MDNSKRQKSSRNNLRQDITGRPMESKERIWIYGYHTVLAALANPQRQKYRFIITSKISLKDFKNLEPEIVDRSHLEKFLPTGAIHQGIALLTSPLPQPSLEKILVEASDKSILLVLDQANDPRNIGAILRSASAFNADAVIIPERHSPQTTSVLAKSASGALEKIPLIRVTNLSRTLEYLKKHGYWCAGMVPDAEQTLANAHLAGKIVLILGAEGKGIRRLTREKCDFLLRIHIDNEIQTLNIAAAAAISLYELKRI